MLMKTMYGGHLSLLIVRAVVFIKNQSDQEKRYATSQALNTYSVFVRFNVPFYEILL